MSLDTDTALLRAVHNNHLSCVKILIENGADTTILTNVGASVLNRAAWGSSGVMKFLLSMVETRKLINGGDDAGYTALHDCSYKSHQSPTVQLENAKMLLQAGASLTIKNQGGETPYECARNLGRNELAKFLWSQLSPEQQAQQNPPPSD